MRPRLDEVLDRIRELSEGFSRWTGTKSDLLDDEFFALCFEKSTLRQVLFLREKLRSRTLSQGLDVWGFQQGVLGPRGFIPLEEMLYFCKEACISKYFENHEPKRIP